LAAVFIIATLRTVVADKQVGLKQRDTGHSCTAST